MPSLTLGFGSFLVVLGLGGYLGSGRASRTALFPTVIGAPVAALGYLARQGKHQELALRLASNLAALGLSRSSPGLNGLVRLVSGKRVERPLAVVAQSVMAAACAGYLAAMRVQSAQEA